MAEPIRVLVVDDHPLYRSGVVASLREYPDLDVVGEGASAEDALRLARDLAPDVVLLDISMPGGGLSAIGRIVALKKPRVVMLTVSEDRDEIVKALEAGAAGYALKGIGGEELVSVIRTVAGGGNYVAPTLAGRLLVSLSSASEKPRPDQALAGLSAREQEVLRHVAQGLSNKEIGRALGLQEKTVKHHMTQILQKLGVRNRVEATILARDHWKI